jgi:hypothetical protein
LKYIRHQSLIVHPCSSFITASTAVANDVRPSQRPAPVYPKGVGEGFGEIVSTYGWYPFLGLGITALVSKELYFLDTEFLLTLNFTGLSIVGYILLRESANNWFEERHAEALKKITDFCDLKSEFIKANITIAERMANAPEVAKDLEAEYYKASEALWKARNLGQRVAYHDSVAKKLKDIAFKEADAVRAKAEAIADSAGAEVLKSYHAAPQSVKDQILKEAIDAVGNTDKSKHALVSAENIFNNYIKSKAK